MKKKMCFLLVLFLISNGVMLSGCWNYREIDKMGIVAGVAIDKGKTKRYKITVDVVNVGQGKESKAFTKLISMEGNTVFDAVRGLISLAGKRLYWSHAKAIIVSRDIAKQGLIKIVDWYNRDSETRGDVDIIVSGEATASEILEAPSATEDVRSYEILSILENEKSLSEAPQEEIWQFINDVQAEGKEAVAPIIKLTKNDGTKTTQIIGTAVFKKDKMIGTLDGADTKYMLFLKNKLKGGILTLVERDKDGPCPVSLEIFKNKTKLTPEMKNGRLEMNLNIVTDVAIDEIGGSKDLIDEYGRKELKKDTEEALKTGVEQLIKKVQSEYDVDIFGFGAKLNEDRHGLWNSIKNTWDQEFKELKVNVTTEIKIRNSAMMSKTIQKGE